MFAQSSQECETDGNTDPVERKHPYCHTIQTINIVVGSTSTPQIPAKILSLLISACDISHSYFFAFIALKDGPMEIDSVRPLLLGARTDCGSKGEHGTIL